MGLNLKGIGKAFSKVSEDYIPTAGKTLSKVKDTAIKKASNSAIKDTGIGIGGGAIAGGIVAGIDGNDDTSIIEGAAVGGIIGGVGGAIYGNRSRIASKFSKNASASTAKAVQETEDAAKNLNIAKNISKTKAGQYSGINESVNSNLNTAKNVNKKSGIFDNLDFDPAEGTAQQDIQTVERYINEQKEPWQEQMGSFLDKQQNSLSYKIRRRATPKQGAAIVRAQNAAPGLSQAMNDLDKRDQMIKQAVKRNALKGETPGQTTILDWQNKVSAQDQRIFDYKTNVLGIDPMDRQMTLLDY